MDKQSDFANPKSLEVCASHEVMTDEFVEYSEEESLDGEEQNEDGSSDEGLAEEDASEEEPDDEDSGAEDSDEEHEEASEEVGEEDASGEEIIEEYISEESEDEPNGKEPLRGSTDQPPLVNAGDVPNLLEQKKTSDVDVPQASGRRRRSGWDIKSEDVTVVNDSGNVGKRKKTRWSSDVKVEASTLVNDSSDANKSRKTRWSSDEAHSGIALLPDSLKNVGHLQKLNAKLQMLNQRLDGNLIVNLPSSQDQNESGKKKNSPKRNFTFCKKMYVPLKEYPGYNFIGLILGPRGNSLRKMEEETGATIRLRGKGSYLKKTCPHNNEDLHVLIESDCQASVDAAVSRVEKLLVPVDDKRNSHKLAQLRELAEIRAVGGKTSLIGKIDCEVCGMSTHTTSGCPLTATELKANAMVMAEASGNKINPEKQIDPARVYVGRLPYSLTSDILKKLFLPYGSLSEATVMFDKSSGTSKGYGIVRYLNPSDAANAVEKMNGYIIDGKQLVVRKAGISPPLEENLPSNPGLDSTDSTFSTTNLPNSSGLGTAFQTCSNAILTSYSGLTAIPPPFLNANVPNHPGLTALPPSSLSANMPSYPRFVSIPPSSSSANLPMFPGHASTNTNLPSYPRFTSEHPSSSGTILPSYTGLASIPSSSSFPGLASIHLSSLNANRPSYPQATALPPSFANANLHSNARPATLSPPITELPNYLGRVDIPQSNSDALHPSSLNKNLQSYPGFGALPSSALSTNMPNYLELAATPSNSNLPSYGLTSMHLSSLNATQPCYHQPATLSPSTLNSKAPVHSGPAVLPTSSSNAYLAGFPGFSANNPSSNVNLPSYSSFAAIPPSSIANLPSYPGFAAIPQKIPEQNIWPGPPGSILPEFGSSFFKSSYSSLAQKGEVPSPSSTSLGKNMSLLDGKKLEITATGIPPPSSIQISPNYTGFAAVRPAFPEPYCAPGVPSELASFPGYLKSIDTYPIGKSVPSSSLSSQPPLFTQNFSSNQINPTLRNYNHPPSN